MAVAEELNEVLGRDKFDRYITREDRERFLTAFLRVAVVIEIAEPILACVANVQSNRRSCRKFASSDDLNRSEQQPEVTVFMRTMPGLVEFQPEMPLWQRDPRPV